MELFLKYRSHLYLLLSIYSSASYFYIGNYESTSAIITGFVVIDTIYNKDVNTKPDYLLHHGLVIASYSTFQYYKFYEYIDITIKPALSFQVSSIFLSINEIYKKNYYYNKYKYINIVCFLASFIYFRLYLYYYSLLNPELYVILNKYNYNLIIIPYMLFSLNVYWFSCIIKKMAMMIYNIQG